MGHNENLYHADGRPVVGRPIQRTPREQADDIKLLRNFSQFRSDQNDLLVLSLAKGHTAPLLLLTEREITRDAAEKVYTDVMAIAHRLSRKYNFSLTKEPK